MEKRHRQIREGEPLPTAMFIMLNVPDMGTIYADGSIVLGMKDRLTEVGIETCVEQPRPTAVSEDAIFRLLAERVQGKFSDVYDYLERAAEIPGEIGGYIVLNKQQLETKVRELYPQ